MLSFLFSPRYMNNNVYIRVIVYLKFNDGSYKIYQKIVGILNLILYIMYRELIYLSIPLVSLKIAAKVAKVRWARLETHCIQWTINVHYKCCHKFDTFWTIFMQFRTNFCTLYIAAQFHNLTSLKFLAIIDHEVFLLVLIMNYITISIFNSN